MNSDTPGSAGHTETMKEALAGTEHAGNVTSDTAVRMGSTLARAAIDPRLKPGTRAYRAALLRTAAGEPDEPLDPGPVGDQPNPDPEPFPWDGMRSHAQLDAYIAEAGLTPPDGWEGMKVVEKKAYLDSTAGRTEPVQPEPEPEPEQGGGAITPETPARIGADPEPLSTPAGVGAEQA